MRFSNSGFFHELTALSDVWYAESDMLEMLQLNRDKKGEFWSDYYSVLQSHSASGTRKVTTFRIPYPGKWAFSAYTICKKWSLSQKVFLDAKIERKISLDTCKSRKT